MDYSFIFKVSYPINLLHYHLQNHENKAIKTEYWNDYQVDQDQDYIFYVVLLFFKLIQNFHVSKLNVKVCVFHN